MRGGRLRAAAAVALLCLAALSSPAQGGEGRILSARNEFGGRTTRVETPDSPDSEYVVLFADAAGRIRKRQVRYPAAFLKEDPRTLGVFFYDEDGRTTRAEYWFSARFIADNRGMYMQAIEFGPEGKVRARETRYDGRDPSLAGAVRDEGPPGEIPFGGD